MAPDQLTPHFSLREMVRTNHRTIDNSPGPDIVEHLRILCESFLEPLRGHFGPLWVTSGYRSHELNVAIGGAWDSAHLYGCAADLVPIEPGVRLDDMVAWVVFESKLPFDQVIREHASTDEWLHLGMLRPQHNNGVPRQQALVMRDGEYFPWRVGA